MMILKFVLLFGIGFSAYASTETTVKLIVQNKCLKGTNSLGLNFLVNNDSQKIVNNIFNIDCSTATLECTGVYLQPSNDKVGTIELGAMSNPRIIEVDKEKYVIQWGVRLYEVDFKKLKITMFVKESAANLNKIATVDCTKL